MKLTTWINKSKLKRIEVSNLLKITYRTLYNYEQGLRPRLEIAGRIVKLTNGDVSFKDLIK